MKRVVVSGLVFLTVLISCKKQNDSLPKQTDEIIPKVLVVKECYTGIIKQDTVVLNLDIKSNEIVTGNLSYNYYEKDDNEGTIEGKLVGDTLLADYTFISEGMSSVREVVFLKKGDTFVEGYGDIEEDSSGKVHFKAMNQLKFDGNNILSKTDCK